MKKLYLIGLGLMSLAGLASCSFGKSEVAGVYGFDSIKIESYGEKETYKKGETYNGILLDDGFMKLTLYENFKMEVASNLTDYCQIGTWSEEDNQITLNYEISNTSETVTKNGKQIQYYNGIDGFSTTINLKRLSDSPDKGVENYHYHSYNETLSYDDYYHWYAPACSHNLYIIQKEHNFENDSCKDCHKSAYNFYIDSDLNYQVYELLDKKSKTHVIPLSYEGHDITGINASCFGLTNTENIYFGKNIKKFVGDFTYAYALKSIYFDGTLDDWFDIEFESASSNPLNKDCHLYLKNNGEYELVEEITIPEDVSLIKSYQYSNFTDLRTVYLSNKTVIQKDAFYGCQNLRDIYYNGTKKEYMDTIGIFTGLSSTNSKITIHVYENGAWTKLN